MSNAESVKEYIRSEEEEKQLGGVTAARFSDGKIRHDLIPPYCLEELAKVYTYGCKKYEDNNWLKGLAWKKNVIGPLKRHLEKWLRGETYDEESGCHHLAMVMWQCCCLMVYEKHKIGIDDRVPYDLDLMEPEERERRLRIWKKYIIERRLHEYNGFNEE